MGIVRIWVATDEEIRTCNIAPEHLELLFPKGSEQRRMTDMPELENRIQRLGGLAIGVSEIVGAPMPRYASKAPQRARAAGRPAARFVGNRGRPGPELCDQSASAARAGASRFQARSRSVGRAVRS